MRVRAGIENRALRENPGQTDLSAQGILSYDVILRWFSIQDQPPTPLQSYRPGLA